MINLQQIFPKNLEWYYHLHCPQLGAIHNNYGTIRCPDNHQIDSQQRFYFGCRLLGPTRPHNEGKKTRVNTGKKGQISTLHHIQNPCFGGYQHVHYFVYRNSYRIFSLVQYNRDINTSLRRFSF